MKKTKYNYDYPPNREVGLNIIHGEVKLIAELTKLSSGYVSDVLNGKRKNKDVINVAQDLIALRNIVKEKHTVANK